MCVSHRDICPILKDPATLTAVIDLFEEHVRKNHQKVDLIVGKKTKCKPVVFTWWDLKEQSNESENTFLKYLLTCWIHIRPACFYFIHYISLTLVSTCCWVLNNVLFWAVKNLVWTHLVSLKCAVRQGCPVCPLLFTLAIKPLACAVCLHLYGHTFQFKSVCRWYSVNPQ